MSRGMLVTCTGPVSQPHSDRTVFATYSAQARAWVYECPTCKFDVRVPDGWRPGLEQQFTEINLHHLAQLMTARREARA